MLWYLFCAIVCMLVACFFVFFILYLHSPACPIFSSEFMLCLVVFSHQIANFPLLLMFYTFLSVCLPRLPCFFCRCALFLVLLKAYGYLTFVFRFLFACCGGLLLFVDAIFVSLFFAICCLGWHVCTSSFCCLILSSCLFSCFFVA